MRSSVICTCHQFVRGLSQAVQVTRVEEERGSSGASISRPSMCSATALSGPCPPTKGASILPYPQLHNFHFGFLGSVIHRSGQRPPIFFLVFVLVLYRFNRDSKNM